MLDQLKAQEAKHAGIANAMKADKAFNESATEYFLRYIAANDGTFFAEDVRESAERDGVKVPDDKRAWGGIVLWLAKYGYIRRVGYGQQRSVSCHGSPKSIWKRV